MIDISNALYKNLEGSILCRESAAHILGLSTDFPTPVRVYNNSVPIKSQFIHVYVNEYGLKDTEDFKLGLRITNEERTICELVKYGANEESILRSIDTYIYSDNKTPEMLLVKATEYGVYAKMKEYVDYVLNNDIYSED